MEEEREPVRVLTRDEKDHYNGLTIDEDGSEAGGSYQQEREQAARYYRVYSSRSPFSRGLSWGGMVFGNDWRARLIRIAALIGVAAVLVLFVSFVLPVLLGAAGIALAFWFIMRLLK